MGEGASEARSEGGKKFTLIDGLAIYMAAVKAPISSSESWLVRPSSIR